VIPVKEEQQKTWFAVARTATKEKPDVMQGFHGDGLLFVIEEGSTVPEEVFAPIEGALTEGNNRLVMVGNPVRNSGYFYKAFHSLSSMFNCLTFNCERSPRVSREYIEDIAEAYGEDSDFYRVRVLGEFPRAAFDQLIPTDVASMAMGRVHPDGVYGHAAKCLGVDVARFGDDCTCFIKRQGLQSWDLERFHGLDVIQVGRMTISRIEQWRPDAVFIDVVGLGAGVYDYVNSQGYGRYLMPVNAGSKPMDPKKFFNKRIEMWWRMLEWLQQGGALPVDPQLLDDLIGPAYGYSIKDTLVLERKEDMRKRGLKSPDAGDALAMTFAEPVSPQTVVLFPNMHRNRQTVSDYDLFGGL